MKKFYMPVTRLIEIEYFINSGRFKFSKKHERINGAEAYNATKAFQLKLAYYLPYDQMVEVLSHYDTTNDSKENWEQFVQSLCVKFNQPKNVIIHRINDVRRILKSRR